MDRNEWINRKYPGCRLSLSARRAWIEMIITICTASKKYPSLSARRAWIEINVIVHSAHPHKVALRKESVDRNVNLRVLDGSKSSSLSARRAWIEMSILMPIR